MPDNAVNLPAATPLHLPQLIGPMQHYLWILKTCHAGADLDVAFQMARGKIDDDLSWNLSDLLQNRNEWWVPGKIVDLRERLSYYWKVRHLPFCIHLNLSLVCRFPGITTTSLQLHLTSRLKLQSYCHLDICMHSSALFRMPSLLHHQQTSSEVSMRRRSGPTGMCSS